MKKLHKILLGTLVLSLLSLNLLFISTYQVKAKNVSTITTKTKIDLEKACNYFGCNGGIRVCTTFTVPGDDLFVGWYACFEHIPVEPVLR